MLNKTLTIISIIGTLLVLIGLIMFILMTKSTLCLEYNAILGRTLSMLECVVL